MVQLEMFALSESFLFWVYLVNKSGLVKADLVERGRPFPCFHFIYITIPGENVATE